MHSFYFLFLTDTAVYDVRAAYPRHETRGIKWEAWYSDPTRNKDTSGTSRAVLDVDTSKALEFGNIKLYSSIRDDGMEIVAAIARLPSLQVCVSPHVITVAKALLTLELPEPPKYVLRPAELHSDPNAPCGASTAALYFGARRLVELLAVCGLQILDRSFCYIVASGRDWRVRSRYPQNVVFT